MKTLSPKVTLAQSRINKCYFEKQTLEQMLRIVRDYKVLFALKNKPSFMQINSGLSLKI